MAKKLKPLQIMVSADIDAEVRAIAGEMELSVSEVLRPAIRRYLPELRRKREAERERQEARAIVTGEQIRP